MKPKRQLLSIDKENFVAAIQALSIYHQDKTNIFIEIQNEYGKEHPAALELGADLETLSSIISFLSDLTQTRNSKSSEHYN